MPIKPVRGLSSVGIVRDAAPWDTPIEAWSAGTNIRFQDGKALRSPVWREILPNLTGSNLSDAHGVFRYSPPAGIDNVFLADSFGRVNRLAFGPSLTDVTDTGFTASSASKQFTSCVVGDVFYLNREDKAPRYYGPASTEFASLPNMDASWTTKLIRGLGDVVVALNVTKSGTTYDHMVKWSGLALSGAPPASWDITDPTVLAGENPLTNLNGPIIDAMNLRNSLVIYSPRDIWIMEPTGEKTFVFTFRRLWLDEKFGSINRNCAIEIDGLHYVFGQQDLYVHDGVKPPQSIADGKVRRHVFSTMTIAEADKFYVAHNPQTSTVLFCYVARDADAVFRNPTGCNKAATFNYRNGTWSFEELPNTTGATVANATLPVTWAARKAAGWSWKSTGGTWGNLLDGYKPGLMMPSKALGGALSASRLYVQDPLLLESRMPVPYSLEANSAAYLEHAGFDMDSLGVSVNASTWVRNIFPQGRLLTGDAPTIRVGTSDFPDTDPVYAQATVWNPKTTYQINTRRNGRYLAFRLDSPADTEFELSGFDLDLTTGGRR